MELKTCHHSFDNGSFCQSPALRGRNYCCYHLSHRGRLMRMARKRSQNQRIFLTLPPLENMHAVQSALSQVVEAVAADMIDLKRAQFLLTALRHAASNFKNLKAWQPSAYVNDPEAPSLDDYPEFEAEYGLPNDLDLATPPEVAFPPPESPSIDLSSQAHAAASAAGVGGSAVSPVPTNITTPLPAFIETTPADIELEEIWRNEGFAAHEVRAREHQRNERRRQRRQNFRANYARYEAEAKARNIRQAAEQLLREKLAAERAAASAATVIDESSAVTAAKKPPAAAAGAPPSVQEEPSRTA